MILDQDKVVFITGGSSGLGRALAVHFSELGFIVHFCGRSLEELKVTLSLLHENKNHRFYQVDLTDDKQLQELYQKIKSTHFEYCILNAGVGFQNCAADLPTTNRVFATNVASVAFLAMNLQYQRLGLVASPQALYPLKNRSLYAASKSAVYQLGNCLRMDGREVTICLPRWFESNLRQNALGVGVNQQKAKKAVGAEGIAKRFILDLVKGERESCGKWADKAAQIGWIVAPKLVEKMIAKMQ